MKYKLRKIKKDNKKRKIVGVGFILLGIIGGALPIMPGFIFLITGLSLISDSYSAAISKSVKRYKVNKKISRLIHEIALVTISEIKTCIPGNSKKKIV